MQKLWNKDEPIIQSLLEVDVYKLLMLGFIHQYYPNLNVKFAFKNRTTDVNLLNYVNLHELNRELEHVKRLRFTQDEISHVRSWGVFPESFLTWLKDFKMGDVSVFEVEESFPDFSERKICIEATGLWQEVTLWETIVLAIISELYTRGRVQKEGAATFKWITDYGTTRLSEKIAILKQNPGVTFAQFGKRRRASKLWEEFVTQRMLEEIPSQMVGVSNIALARKLGVPAIGTNAHELPMALYALGRHSSDADARSAPYVVLEKWQRLYGHKMLIALPDTFGTDTFLASLSREYLDEWRGFRQDSGNEIEFGEKIIAQYEQKGIDSKDKLIIFSDGLNVNKMIELYNYFAGRINVTFGWGTNLTNDIGIQNLSLVMKLVESAGNPAVKLSDNLNKAVGTDVEVAEAKRIFGYINTFSEGVTY